MSAVDTAVGAITSAAREAIEPIEADLTAALARQTDLESQVTAAGAQLDDANLHVTELRSQLSASTTKVTALEAQVEQLQSAFPGFTVIAGDLVLKDAGDIREGVLVMGQVKRAAKGCGLRKAIVLGPKTPTASSQGCIELNQDGFVDDGFLIEDVTLYCQTPSPWVDGVSGNNYAARRVHAYGVGDAFRARASLAGKSQAANVLIEQADVHDLNMFSADPQQSNGPAHRDDIQIDFGFGIKIIGGTLDARSVMVDGTAVYRPSAEQPTKSHGGSGIVINQALGQTGDVEITGVTLRGGYANINLSPGTKYTLPAGAVKIKDTKHGRDIFDNYPARSDKRYIVLPQSELSKVSIDNATFEDNGAPLKQGRATGISLLTAAGAPVS